MSKLDIEVNEETTFNEVYDEVIKNNPEVIDSKIKVVDIEDFSINDEIDELLNEDESVNKGKGF